MQQIADKVGVHVTTVSRAVDDKWIQTPRGILPLKRFFVGGTQTDDGEDVAWDTIRLKLQELIDKEDKSDPYSDEKACRGTEEDRHGRCTANCYQIPQKNGDSQQSDSDAIGRSPRNSLPGGMTNST